MTKLIKVFSKIFVVIVLFISSVASLPVSILLRKDHEPDELEKTILKDEI